MRRGGPRPRRRLLLLVLVPRVVRLLVAGRAVVVAVFAAVLPGRGYLLARDRLRPRLVLRRRRELALVAARVGRHADVAPVPTVLLPVVLLRRRAVPTAGTGRPGGGGWDDQPRGGFLLIGVVGVERALERRRGGALVLAHLLEVDCVPHIVAVPGAELGHAGPILHDHR